MSAATDKGVLAVMEAHAQIRADAIVAAEVRGRGPQVMAKRQALLNEALDARATVAELIEAAQDVAMNRHHENPDELSRSLDRLDVAIARCGGAQ